LKIRKALIIADPWIGYILDGSKTWEMRSNAVSHRGWFGLIRKGTGAVYGVARLVDTGASLSPDEMIATFERHRIPENMIRSGEVAKWNTPWILSDVQRLSSPVPYRHRSGAVTWVELDADVTEKIPHYIREPFETTPELPRAKPLPTRQSSIINPGESQRAIQQASAPDHMIADGALIGQIEITQGNIDNNHIYLRSFFDRFPEDAVGGSNRHEKAARNASRLQPSELFFKGFDQYLG